MKALIKTLFFIVFLNLMSFQIAVAQDGKTMFQNNCGFCHSIGGGKVVGPDLKDITIHRAENWLIKFVQNSTELINSGDEEAIAIFNEYNKMPMPSHPNLNDAQVKDILAYIADVSASLVPKQEEAVIAEATLEPTALNAAVNWNAVFFSGSWQSNLLLFLIGSTSFLIVITGIIVAITFKILLRFK
jgi:cytochrome c551/c552